jgi:hypothetical protein
MFGSGQGDSDGGGFVIGTRGGDGAVVVGTHEQWCEASVVSTDHADQIAE